MSIARSASFIALWTGVSRVLGFLRDIMIARVVGQGMASDAFFVAFRFPNLFRRLFGEGALNAAFVPIFGKELEADPAAAESFARRTFTLLCLIMVLITVLTIVFAPGVVLMLAEGYRDSSQPGGGEKFRLSVELTRICAAYSAFICLAALASGVLNTLRSFAVPAFAPVLLNVITVAALALAWALGTPVYVLSWAVFLAGLAQLALVWAAAWKRGIRLLPHFEFGSGKPWAGLWTPRIRRLFILMGPGVMAAAAQQIGTVLTTNIASRQEDAVSFLYNGDRVQQLPLGMIGIAIGTVLLPELSRSLGRKDHGGATRMFRQGISIASLLTLPAAVALIVLGPLVFQALYWGGRFSWQDTLSAGYALQLFALGMPLWVLVKVVLPGYFAREDTRTPLIFSAISVGLNVLLAWLLYYGGIAIPAFAGLPGFEVELFPAMQAYGVALASSLAAVVNFGLLVWGLRHDPIMSLDRSTWHRIGSTLLASLTMGAGLWFALWALRDFAGSGIWQARITLAVLIGFGLTLYGFIVISTRLFTVAELKAAVRR